MTLSKYNSNSKPLRKKPKSRRNWIKTGFEDSLVLNLECIVDVIFIDDHYQTFQGSSISYQCYLDNYRFKASDGFQHLTFVTMLIIVNLFSRSF